MKNEYEEVPCSVYVPNPEKRVKFPTVCSPIEEVEEASTATPESRKAKSESPKKESKKKKSCIPNAKPHPPHPAIRKKTVAFGATVNVSQTIEGTSRLAKKQQIGKKQNMSEKGELEDLRQNFEALSTKMEEVEKEREEKWKQRDEQMQTVINAIQQLLKPEEKENKKPPQVYEVPKRGGGGGVVLEAYHLPILQQRMKVDPIFRQKIMDVLADADADLFEQKPRREQTRPTPSATLHETVTVQRSIICDDPMSIDTRRFLNKNHRQPPPTRRYDRYVDEEEEEVIDDAPLHSTYQPGNSISYYPTTSDRRNHQRHDYIVECTSDNEEDFSETRRTAPINDPDFANTIRQKYAKRHV